MFTRIAPRYDLMNRLMTAGQDVHWRREVIRRAGLQAGARLLDLGSGTGDLAREALRQQPQVVAVAADFTLQMMLTGRVRHPRQVHPWVAADALRLPFASQSFDAVVSGFLLRNVSDLPLALTEQYRILAPGGTFVSLDTTRPPQNILTPFITLYLRVVIPWLGKLITGEAHAYTYLPQTTACFVRAEELAQLLRQAGYAEVGFARRNFGTVAIHWGKKAG